MLDFHLENGELPPCPPQLTVETHITKEEEALMDIGTEKTEEFRQELQETVFHGDIMNSDAIEGLQDIMEASRKRAASNVSQMSSSQQPSPTKKTQRGRGRE